MRSGNQGSEIADIIAETMLGAGDPYKIARAEARVTLRLCASHAMFCAFPSCGRVLDCERNCTVLEDIIAKPGMVNVPKMLAVCDACGETVRAAIQDGRSVILGAKLTRSRDIEAGAALPVSVEAPAVRLDASGQLTFEEFLSAVSAQDAASGPLARAVCAAQEALAQARGEG